MRWIVFAAMVLTAPVAASEIENQHDAVLQCLSLMETETTWPQCRTMIFKPCQDHTVGSDDHLGCLETEKTGWQTAMDTRRELLDQKLTANGSAMLADLLGRWFGYVANKCQAVAEAKSGISADAAFAGCEVSEMAGISSDFETCLKGNSTSPYCIHKE